MERHEQLAPQGILQWDINSLVRELRQERLFVTSEQQELQTLNVKVINDSNKLAQTAWITAQQRLNLNRLILSRPDSTPAICCQKANTLETAHFIDAYKALQYQDVLLYGDFLQTLRTSPELLAQCLAVGEKVAGQQLALVLPSLTAGLFGSLVLPQDTILMLRLLKHLTQMQLVASDNPRRLLRHGSCAFARLYSAFHEGLFSAKLFLTAALQSPIMQLLMDFEYFLDIDPDKAVIRFAPVDRRKNFGKEGTPDYVSRVGRYRKWTINSLVAVTMRFITSLRENMHCFPAPLSWLVKQIAGLLTKSGNFDDKEVNAMCTDLVFTCFICPAMVNPEPYGITNAPISYISRFNLIQVAQIIQMLALIKYQDVDPKVMDLYSRFDKSCVSSLLDAILADSSEQLEEVPLSADSAELQGIPRSSALFTEAELYHLVDFLQTVLASLDQSEGETAEAVSPHIMVNDVSEAFSINDRERLSLLLGALPTRVGNGVVKSPSNDNILKTSKDSSPSEVPLKKAGILAKVPKPRINRSLSSSLSLNPTLSDHNEDRTNNSQNNSRPNSSGSESEATGNSLQDVLIIPLNVPQIEFIGLLPEQKVLSMELSNGFSSSTNLDSVTLTNNVDDFISEQDSEERDQIADPNGLVLSSGQEKRTRFSLSHDEGSIGNTSDNLEAISEAASNHSVASSLELENEDQNDNDNLSDMISANVSGRGTPNISGRDTPSSQVTEGDEANNRQIGGEARQPYLPPPQPVINKQIRSSEIDDKFCKFEIKKLLEGDETVSIISDTWSTDVLASDSETVEASERPSFMPPVVERLERDNRPNVVESLGLDETQSESAWSTDVLASDSERMTEVDTDDTASVAPSDDTASVARSDDTGRSEIEDPPTVHRPIPISLPTNVISQQCNALPNSLLNNGPASASSSQPGSPLDVSSPYNLYSQHSASGSGHFNPHMTFRPIRDDSIGNSPIRHIHTPPNINVTGKGGRQSDYRRRTLEYVDSNANSILQHTTAVITEASSSTNTSTVTESVITRTELVERFSSSTMRNSNSRSLTENTTRREAILLDSNSLNGIELLLDEKEQKTITKESNSTPYKDSSLLSPITGNANGLLGPNVLGPGPNSLPHSPGSGGILSKSANEAISDVGRAAASPVLLLTFPKRSQPAQQVENEISDIVVRLSNASIHSSSSASSCSSSEMASKTQNSAAANGINEQWNNDAVSLANGQWPTNGNTASQSATGVTGVVENGTRKNSSGSNLLLSSAIKPTSSTGAIPKSISFDMTAEKGDKDLLDEESKNKRGFFGKLKMGFKNRRGKSLRGVEDIPRYDVGPDGDVSRFRRYTSEDIGATIRMANASLLNETTDDILAKYRRKPSTSSDANASDSMASGCTNVAKRKSAGITGGGEDNRWTIDQSNVESSFAFADAKRKLRHVLSTATDLQNSAWEFSNAGRVLQMQNNSSENELISFLRIQLAKARNLGDWSLVALVTETLRCVSLFDTAMCRKLLIALRQEHNKRGSYIRYLIRCRQELLATLSHLENLTIQITSDRQLSNSYLVAVCVRMFLEKRENAVLQFCEEFRTLTLADEKTDLLDSFLQTLSIDMDRDVNWQAASESQLEQARIAIERILMSRVYVHAMFPNGDVDISRDQVLHEHIKKLSKVVTPSHKDLRIHKIYHYECPWPSAQESISAIAAYKTARDKVQCIVRCAVSIMHLLSLAAERAVPTADDFTPVLVYVIIKANPPSLLSTVQYVNSFYGNRLAGEEQYWWIQFCSAVEFIKTMDYSD